MKTASMAWRNVWRNKRRSVVTMIAMTFALSVQLLYAGIIPGYLNSMEQDIVDLEVGDIQIHAMGYVDDPDLYTRIEGVPELLERLESAGYTASPQILGGGLAAAGKSSSGVAFIGVDPQRHAKVSKLPSRLSAGEWLAANDPAGVVLGQLLADNLGVTLTDEVVVMSQAADGSMANDLYRVRGVLHPVAEGTDRSAMFMNIAALRELLVIPSGAHRVIVRRPPNVQLTSATQSVAELAPGLDVRNWQSLMPIVAQMLESAQAMIYVISFVVYIAVAMLILNAMLMAVFERIREFGVLKALGVKPTTVLSLILLESAILTAISVVLGFAISLPAMWYLATHGIDVGALGGTSMMGVATRQVWIGVFTADSMLAPVIMLCVMVLVASTYPALKAAFIKPITAMRHQ